jgi:hypothetical protein
LAVAVLSVLGVKGIKEGGKGPTALPPFDLRTVYTKVEQRINAGDWISHHDLDKVQSYVVKARDNAHKRFLRLAKAAMKMTTKTTKPDNDMVVEQPETEEIGVTNNKTIESEGIEAEEGEEEGEEGEEEGEEGEEEEDLFGDDDDRPKIVTEVLTLAQF